MDSNPGHGIIITGSGILYFVGSGICITATRRRCIPESMEGIDGGNFAEGEHDVVSSLGPEDMFVDPSFPPEDSSLYKDVQSRPDYAVAEGKGDDGSEVTGSRWKRPALSALDGDDNKWASDPELFLDEASRGGVLRGSLDDRWFIGALAAVAAHPAGLLENLFVSTEHWKAHGVLTCRMYRDGEWIEVVIDTLIPVGDSATPLYGRCTDGTQHWVQLIEKAYAKLLGRCVLDHAGGYVSGASQGSA